MMSRREGIRRTTYYYLSNQFNYSYSLLLLKSIVVNIGNKIRRCYSSSSTPAVVVDVIVVLLVKTIVLVTKL